MITITIIEKPLEIVMKHRVGSSSGPVLVFGGGVVGGGMSAYWVDLVIFRHFIHCSVTLSVLLIKHFINCKIR